MADKFDGSININAKVNTDEFKKGVKEVEAGAKEIEKKVNEAGRGMKSAGKDSNKIVVKTEVDQSGFKAGTEALHTAIDSFKKKFDNFEGQIRDKFNKMFQAPAQAATTQGPTASMAASLEEINKAYDELGNKKKVSEAIQQLEHIRYLINQMGNQTYNRNGESVLGFDTEEFDHAAARYEAVSKQIMSTAKQAGQVLQGRALANEQAFQRFQVTVDSFDTSNLEQQGRIIADLEMQLQTYASDGNAGTERYEKMAAKLEELTAAYRKNAQAAAENQQAQQAPESTPYTAAWDAAMQKIAEAPRLTEMVSGAMRMALEGIAGTAGSVMARVSAAIHDPVDALNRALGSIGREAVGAVSGLLSLGGGAVKGALQGVYVAAENTAKSLLKMAGNTVVSGIKRLTGAMIGLGRGSDSMGAGMKRNFTTILKYAFGIRSIYFLFRKLRSALMDGFSSLMQYDSALASDVNNLKSALMGLRNAFAAALAPLAQMVIPVITSIINTITAAVNRIGALIAALTGKGSYIRATNAQAAATGGAADAFRDEAKAAKEAKKTIAGFDDLTILDDNSDNGGGGSPGGGGGGGGGGLGFEEVPIDSQMADLAEMLKDMWAKADFTELGKMLGEKLRDALNSIPWDIIKDFARRLGKSIATFLNGFLEVPGLFDAIGRTLAQALNTAFEFLHAFITNFHWDSLGAAVRDGILGFLNNLDWNLIYATAAGLGRGLGQALEEAIDNPEVWNGLGIAVAKGISSIVAGISQFITNVDWGSVGTNIGNGINTGVALFPWNEIGSTITAALNGAFSFLYNWLTTVNFYAVGEHIGTSITNAIHDFDWNKAGATFAQVFNALFNILNGFMENTDFKALGAGVIDAIAGFFGDFDWASAGAFVSNVISSLFGFLSGAVQKINWVEIPGEIIRIMGDFLGGVDWGNVASTAMELLGSALGAAFSYVVGLLVAVGGTIYDAFKNIIDGGLQGIIDALANIGTWIVENVFVPFIDGIMSAFGIASPATTMLPIGGYIVEGLLNGILAPLTGIFNWLSEHVGGPIIDGVKKLFGVGGKPALEDSGASVSNGFVDGMGNAISGVASWIKGHFTDPVKDTIENDLGTNGTPVTNADGKAVVEGLKDGIDSGASGIEKYIDSTVTDPVLSGIKDPFGISGSGGDARQFAEFGKSAMSSMKAGLVGGTNAVVDQMKQISNNLQEAIKQIKWADIGSFVTKGVMEGIKGGSNAVVTVMRNLAQSLPKTFSNVRWSNIGKNICSGIGNGLRSGWHALTNLAWNMATSIFNSACNALGIHSPSKKFYWIAEMITAALSGGVRDTAGDAVDAIAATADAMMQEAEDNPPIVPIQTALDGSLVALDETMMNFADRVVGGFEAMIASLQEIAGRAAFSIPQAAMGSVAPYAARVSAGNASASQDAAAIMQLLSQQSGGRVTRDDLEEILRAVAEDYFNFDFYLGDEQVARSANRGNLRLNRRFSPTK